MKTVFIMGILSFFCGISAAQPQYWGGCIRFGKCRVRNERGQVLFQGKDIRRGL